MTAGTLMVDPELARQALGDVLDNDAAAQPSASAPPRRVYEGATPEAPFGYKADGTPRKSPPGPGRPRLRDKDNTARVDDSPPGRTIVPAAQAAAEARAGADYTDEIASALVMAWMGLSAIPFTQAHAYVLHQHTGELVPAWNKAAQQNATIRRAVLKLSGEGSFGWVLPVAATTTPLVLGLVQATLAPADKRAELREKNASAFHGFLMDQATAAGLTIPEAQSLSTMPPDPAQSGQSDDGSTPSSPQSSPSSNGSSAELSDLDL